MSKTIAYDENSLLLQIATGDEKAFIALMNIYSSKIYAHVYMYLKDKFLAEEITQDVFLKIWRGKEDLPNIVNFPGYLHVVTRNVTISALRKKLNGSFSEVQSTLETNAPDPLKALEYREMSDVILNAIEKLPPRRKEVFKLSRIEGMTYEQIAKQLNISKGTVNEHIVESIYFLKMQLKGKEGIGFTIAVAVQVSTLFK